jgi:hypothetical protein
MRTVLEDISKMAVDKAVENGATRESVKIAEMDAIPINVFKFLSSRLTPKLR